ASIDVLRGSVALLPLLIGHVELKEFVLIRPRVHLKVDRRGRENWAVGRRGETESGGEPPPIADVHIGSFRVEDGAVDYENQRSGTTRSATAINAVIAWPRLSSKLAATGSPIWNGENVRASLG